MRFSAAECPRPCLLRYIQQQVRLLNLKEVYDRSPRLGLSDSERLTSVPLIFQGGQGGMEPSLEVYIGGPGRGGAELGVLIQFHFPKITALLFPVQLV